MWLPGCHLVFRGMKSPTVFWHIALKLSGSIYPYTWIPGGKFQPEIQDDSLAAMFCSWWNSNSNLQILVFRWMSTEDFELNSQTEMQILCANKISKQHAPESFNLSVIWNPIWSPRCHLVFSGMKCPTVLWRIVLKLSGSISEMTARWSFAGFLVRSTFISVCLFTTEIPANICL